MTAGIVHVTNLTPGGDATTLLSGGGAGRWTEVPHHGHAVATVFTGSVLDRITAGRYKLNAVYPVA
jgi:hypothetical protein